MTEFELFTRRGNVLAAHLVGRVAAGVADGTLTRESAVRATCEAVADIRSIDAGMGDSEPHYAIAHAVGRAFRARRWDSIDGDELMTESQRWRRGEGSAYAADGMRHFEDPSMEFDRDELAFFDAVQAIDAIEGAVNTVNYWARMPEGRGAPTATLAPPFTEAEGIVVRAGQYLEATVEWNGAPLRPADLANLPGGGEHGKAVAELLSRVEAANRAVAPFEGMLLPLVRDIDGRRTLLVEHYDRVTSAISPAYVAVPEGTRLDMRRRPALQAAYETFDFGLPVEDADGWEWTTPGDEYTREVYLTSGAEIHPDDHDLEGETVSASFTVRFEPGGTRVAEAYAMVNGQLVEAAPVEGPRP